MTPVSKMRAFYGYYMKNIDHKYSFSEYASNYLPEKERARFLVEASNNWYIKNMGQDRLRIPPYGSTKCKPVYRPLIGNCGFSEGDLMNVSDDPRFSGGCSGSRARELYPREK